MLLESKAKKAKSNWQFLPWDFLTQNFISFLSRLVEPELHFFDL